MHQTIRTSRSLKAIVATAAALFLLTACSSTGDAAPTTSASTSASASAPAASAPASDVDDSAIEADLTAAGAVVDTAIAEYPEATQVILTTTEGPMDIQYGAVSAYFVPSAATEDVTGTVSINAGAYTISGTSAESGITYTIDETGTVTSK